MFIMGLMKQIESKKITSKCKEQQRLRYYNSFQEQNICRQAFQIINDSTEEHQ